MDTSGGSGRGSVVKRGASCWVGGRADYQRCSDTLSNSSHVDPWLALVLIGTFLNNDGGDSRTTGSLGAGALVGERGEGELSRLAAPAGALQMPIYVPLRLTRSCSAAVVSAVWGFEGLARCTGRSQERRPSI